MRNTPQQQSSPAFPRSNITLFVVQTENAERSAEVLMSSESNFRPQDTKLMHCSKGADMSAQKKPLENIDYSMYSRRIMTCDET